MILFTSHCVECVPPPELDHDAWALPVIPEAEAEAEVAAIAELLPLVELPLAVALAEAFAEAAIAWLALNARPSNRQVDTKLFKTFIDTPLWD